MTPEAWLRKIRAFLHDPPLKQDALYGKGGHNAFARTLTSELFPDDPGADIATHGADLWASAADRPEVGSAKHICVPFRVDGLVTHPLDDAPLRLLTERAALMPTDNKAAVSGTIRDRADADLLAEQASQAAAAASEAAGTRLSDVELLDQTWHWLWRTLRGQLAAKANPAQGAWRRYVDLHPADSRAPDHSLWDHVRLTSALAFGPSPTAPPWLMTVSIGPVGAWLKEVRTTRDAWVASMILSEVSLAAMGPIIEAYGPDAILFPDLARNARYDRELAQRARPDVLLTQAELEARTRAALIPNKWLAVLPHDADVRALGRAAQDAAWRWWTELSEGVLEGFLAHLPKLDPAARADVNRDISSRWRQQVRRHGELFAHWAAVPWTDQRLPPGAAMPPPAISLPGQPQHPAAEATWRAARRHLLRRFPATMLRRADRAHHAFAAVIRRKGGGHHYGTTWLALRDALTARGAARTFAAAPLHPGETCTMCSHRPALAGGKGTADQQRESGKEFWGKIAADRGWDSAGEERLCAVCATKRFLVPPWDEPLPNPTDRRPLPRFHHVWAHAADAEEGRLRLPMPSTAAVAAAPWLAAMLDDDSLASERAVLVAALRKHRWPMTFYPRSLPGLGGRPGAADPLSWYEPSLYYRGPRGAELSARAAADPERFPVAGVRPADQEIGAAVAPLVKKLPRLSSRFAVIAIDGDRLGELIAGTSIVATWRSALHPKAVERILTAQEPWAQPWREILDEPRLMSPALHAAINRAVTAFANRIVPWVVEREHRGRLIYAGGDDVLAVAPADEALSISARLASLWSSPWVNDAEPGRSAWEPRLRWDADSARARFTPVDGRADLPADGELMMMLGQHHTLSAGIAYAHFKTPLGLVIEAARDALDDVAKGAAGRGACAETMFTRNGPKLRSVFRWGAGGGGFAQTVADLRRDFREGRLSSRTPYKLYGQGDALTSTARPDRLGLGLVRVALDGPSPHAEPLWQLWREGIRAFKTADDGLGNLLLCRALASEEDEG